MGTLNERLNQIISFSAGKGTGGREQSTPQEQAAPQESAPEPVLSFDSEQAAVILDALGLEEGATPDQVVATLLEKLDVAPPATAEDVAAAIGQSNVIIDQDTWKSMESAIKAGLQTQVQGKRLAAEQVVDQAIRFGKASTGEREKLIQQYHLDPRGTQTTLSNRPTAPMVELGNGHDVTHAEYEEKGWVRP